MDSAKMIDLANEVLTRGLFPYNGRSVLVPVASLQLQLQGRCPVCRYPLDGGACQFVKHDPVDWADGISVVYVECARAGTDPMVVDVRTMEDIV